MKKIATFFVHRLRVVQQQMQVAFFDVELRPVVMPSKGSYKILTGH
jgi:hypothetical protein